MDLPGNLLYHSIFSIRVYVTLHPPLHHLLETHYDSVVHEPQLSYTILQLFIHYVAFYPKFASIIQP
jgi:hypothetical protein